MTISKDTRFYLPVLDYNDADGYMTTEGKLSTSIKMMVDDLEDSLINVVHVYLIEDGKLFDATQELVDYFWQHKAEHYVELGIKAPYFIGDDALNDYAAEQESDSRYERLHIASLSHSSRYI